MYAFKDSSIDWQIRKYKGTEGHLLTERSDCAAARNSRPRFEIIIELSLSMLLCFSTGDCRMMKLNLNRLAYPALRTEGFTRGSVFTEQLPERFVLKDP